MYFAIPLNQPKTQKISKILHPAPIPSLPPKKNNTYKLTGNSKKKTNKKIIIINIHHKISTK